MHDFVTWVTSLKAGVFTSFAGAALAVLLEFKRHTWATALLALISGVFVASIATEPVVDFLRLSGNAENAIAGVLGISGRGLIVWVLGLSKDPWEAWKNRK